MESTIKLFDKQDLEIVIAFLKEKGILQKNLDKKIDVEAYLDNGNNSIVVVSNKKRPKLLKNVMEQKIIAVYEVRANEDYSVLVQLPEAHEPIYAERDIYYPDFKQAYIENQKTEQNIQSEK